MAAAHPAAEQQLDSPPQACARAAGPLPCPPAGSASASSTATLTPSWVTGADLESGGLSSDETDNSDDDDDEEELVVLPAQLEAIGALLSTPTGGASALCKGAHALLDGYMYPLWGVAPPTCRARFC